MPWWAWLVVAWLVPGVSVAVYLRDILNPAAMLGAVLFSPLFLPLLLVGRTIAVLRRGS